MELIRYFSKICKRDVSIAGGKGASLGEMTQSGIPVPEGFVILSNTFDKFIEETDLNVEIDSILDKVNYQDIHTVENASEEINSLILSKKMPEDIAKDIANNFVKLGAKFVAVRSSATSEDSGTAAWAGQLESYLNTTRENLLENVKKCWASLFTPRAIFYRKEKNLHKSKISVAVVVQKMVDSKCSGIAFSVHPVTQDKNQIIIEACFGLGEAIVSGQITPDSYVIEKKPRRIIDKNINAQTRGIYKNKKGGTEWKSLEKEFGEKQVISDKEIFELTEIVLNIEKHYGFPCDIEWAREKGKFYIVQSRPITTLTQGKSINKEYRAVFTRPFSLLRMQFESQGEFEGIKNLTSNKFYFKPFFVYSPEKGVTAYYNFSSDEENIQFILEYLNDKVPYVKKELIKIKKICAFLENELKEKKLKSPKKIFSCLTELQPFSSLGNLVGHLPFASKELFNTFKSFRYDYDGLIYKVEQFMLENAKEKLDKKLKNFVNILSFEELFEGKIPKNLEERKRCFIYYLGELVINDLESFLKNKSFYISEERNISEEIIKGSSAYSGTIRGIVKKIYLKEDINKFNEGDILVTPMTIPDFVSIMKKASAFITDEGGITCHAAIIAREMKKPCIIGTKNATKILKDGDEVEVDANKGEVRILKRTPK